MSMLNFFLIYEPAAERYYAIMRNEDGWQVQSGASPCTLTDVTVLHVGYAPALELVTIWLKDQRLLHVPFGTITRFNAPFIAQWHFSEDQHTVNNLQLSEWYTYDPKHRETMKVYNAKWEPEEATPATALRVLDAKVGNLQYA